jgi:hypothetical protein
MTGGWVPGGVTGDGMVVGEGTYGPDRGRPPCPLASCHGGAADIARQPPASTATIRLIVMAVPSVYRRPDQGPKARVEGPSLNNKPQVVERRSLGFARDDGGLRS